MTEKQKEGGLKNVSQIYYKFYLINANVLFMSMLLLNLVETGLFVSVTGFWGWGNKGTGG